MSIHTAIRAYAFRCSYNSLSWIDSPATLVSAIQTALSGISNFSYKNLMVANVKNVAGKNVAIEIDGITYQTKTKLNASENDSLISDIQTALNGISNFVYNEITITNDIFTDDKTTNWPDKSMEEE